MCCKIASTCVKSNNKTSHLVGFHPLTLPTWRTAHSRASTGKENATVVLGPMSPEVPRRAKWASLAWLFGVHSK